MLIPRKLGRLTAQCYVNQFPKQKRKSNIKKLNFEFIYIEIFATPDDGNWIVCILNVEKRVSVRHRRQHT